MQKKSRGYVKTQRKKAEGTSRLNGTNQKINGTNKKINGTNKIVILNEVKNLNTCS